MYKYPHISYGYLGKQSKNATINAAFFAEYWQHPELFKQQITFPQRIPKVGYFSELCELEDENFLNELQNIVDTIKQQLNKYLIDKNTIENNPHIVINLILLMLRYSMFDDIVSIEIPNNINTTITIEIKFLQAVATLEISLSKNTDELSLDELIHIAEQITIKNAQEKFELILINRVIVYFYRYQAQADHSIIMSLLEKHINQIKNFSAISFSSNILRSICYRGLAMANDLGLSKQKEFLDLAEHYARTIEYHNKIDQLIRADNLCTCLLSVAKWNIQIKNYTKAEAIFSEICALDPFDPIGYCEMGILLNRLNRTSEACHYFQKAASLGPPGVGMNTYFHAKCLENMQLQDEAIATLHQAAILDKNAVSPLLDLFDYYKNQDNCKAKNIAREILSSTILKAQLEQDEINNLELVNNNE